MSKMSKMMGGGAKGDQRTAQQILPEVPVSGETAAVKSNSDVIPPAPDNRRKRTNTTVALGL